MQKTILDRALGEVKYEHLQTKRTKSMWKTVHDMYNRKRNENETHRIKRWKFEEKEKKNHGNNI